jgi:hypothetical protein
VYASYSTQSGFSTGWSAGLSPQMGFPINTNFLSIGVNYNITHYNWSGNVSAWGVDKNGWTFNPSVSAMIYPEHTTNWVRGKGFNSNEKVFQNFKSGKYTIPEGSSWQQETLNYFGFKGTYDPNIREHGRAHKVTGDITYGNRAFESNFDNLALTAYHEMRHRRNVLSGRAKDTRTGVHQEEWSTYLYNYRNQGLYRNHGDIKTILDKINLHGYFGGKYTTYGPYNINFTPKWWHFIYRIPRLW